MYSDLVRQTNATSVLANAVEAVSLRRARDDALLNLWITNRRRADAFTDIVELREISTETKKKTYKALNTKSTTNTFGERIGEKLWISFRLHHVSPEKITENFRVFNNNVRQYDQWSIVVQR